MNHLKASRSRATTEGGALPVERNKRMTTSHSIHLKLIVIASYSLRNEGAIMEQGIQLPGASVLPA